MKKTDLTDTISKVFNRKRVSKMAPINTLIEHPNNSRNSLKYETYDQLKSNLSQIDNILTERLDNEMSQSGDGEERIQRYLEDPRLYQKMRNLLL